MKAFVRDHSGFSMVEVLVSAGILAIGILGMAYQQSAQKNAKATLVAQNMGRTELSRIVDDIALRPGMFPYFQNGGAQPVTYVGCFDPFGNQIQTAPTAVAAIRNKWDYVGTFLIDPNSVSAFTQAYTGASRICAGGNGGYEVHVASWPRDSHGYKISVAVIPLTATSGAVSAVPLFKTTLRLAAPTSAGLTGNWGVPAAWLSATLKSGRYCGVGATAPETTCRTGNTCPVTQNQTTGNQFVFCY